jgi:hypothetical protein
VSRWGEQHHLRPVLLMGPGEMIDAVFRALPSTFRSRVALHQENLSPLSTAALHARVEPVVARWRRQDEVGRVETLLDAAGSDRVAVGLEQALARLQEGRVRELMIARRIEGTVRQCERCGWVDRLEGRDCVRCGGQRHTVAVRVVIPELARRHGVSVDIVAGRAAARLRRVQGIAAWLTSDRRRTRRRAA